MASVRTVAAYSKKIGLIYPSCTLFSTFLGKWPAQEFCKDNVQNDVYCERRLQTNIVRGSASTPLDTVNNKTMGQEPGDAELFCEDYFHRRASTVEDEQLIISLLKDVIELRNKNVSSWIVESKVKTLCCLYKSLLKPHRHGFIRVLARDHAVDHKQVSAAARVLLNSNDTNELKISKNEDTLRTLLTPQYSWLFIHMGKLENGVKFLVDLRTDVLDMISELESGDIVELQQLNVTLKDLLSLWFSVGFLDLERVTWRSPCEMLQKISEYEAVHPVRSWTDLKRRVGPYRRCFVFLHSSMPGEPLVVLHTALCDEISSSTKGLVASRSRMSVDTTSSQELLVDPQVEDSDKVKAAVFYSITSTQRGLQGIELGNYLIKRVVRELQTEFPTMTQFSSLSPIPKFKSWFFEKFKTVEKGHIDIFTQEEIQRLSSHLNLNGGEFWKELKRLLNTNSWNDDNELVRLLKVPLMRCCVKYLYLEKRRGYALDSVANFHLRNGAVMWRLNWQADLSPRGLTNSCGMMLNYRYFLDETESNSRSYLENQIINASEQIKNLAEQAKHVNVISKM